jgi:hypothetical protein
LKGLTLRVHRTRSDEQRLRATNRPGGLAIAAADGVF